MFTTISNTLQNARKNIVYDFPSGLVVFLVALPLCLGIALASDAPLLSGLLTGMIAGIVVSLLSGSALSVSGPAAGLTVIVASAISELGSFEALLAATFVAGILQIAMGLLRLGSLATFFPNAVIQGMLAAIGITIVLKQIPHALGRDSDYEGNLGFWDLGGESNTFTDILAAVQSISPGALLITAACLAILVTWNHPTMKQQAWTRWVPGPLVAVVAGVVMNRAFQLWVPGWEVLAEDGHMVAIPPVDGFKGFFAAFTSPRFDLVGTQKFWVVSGTIALVASIETLLCLEATDKLDPQKRISSSNQELVAQGAGNMLCGLVGGIPMTSVIVRSSANVYSGARSPLSSFIHGIFLLLSVVFLAQALNWIPLCALAAVLISVGYKLANVSLFKHMLAKGIDQFVPFMATIVFVVFTDLLQGVLMGLVVGLAVVIRTNHYSAIAVYRNGTKYTVSFLKDVSFLNKHRLKSILSDIPPQSYVTIDGSRALYIDADIYAVLDSFEENAKQNEIQIEYRELTSKRFTIFEPDESEQTSDPEKPTPKRFGIQKFAPLQNP